LFGDLKRISSIDLVFLQWRRVTLSSGGIIGGMAVGLLFLSPVGKTWQVPAVGVQVVPAHQDPLYESRQQGGNGWRLRRCHTERVR
jgi:hypothetical protein